MAKTPTNEGRCCDAVLRILETQHGAKREAVVRDTQEHRGIEVSCVIGDQHYALEHTLIEPFPNNQRDDILFSRVFDAAFETAIADLLQPDLAYTITVNVYAFSDFSSKQLTAVRADLLVWARATVGKLPEPSRDTGSVETRIHAEPPQAPIRVTLACHRSTALGGRMLPGRFAPSDLENLRHTRLLKALGDKGPKLHATSAGTARTVLVVENHDFAITNEVLLRDAFDELCMRVAHSPDDIYVVDTRIGVAFRVTQVRRERRACLFMGENLGDWEYAAAQLDDI